MPETITINLFYVWLAAKIAIGLGLLRWENKSFPARQIHEKIRRGMWHILFNPELSMVKGLCFPVSWLMSGTKNWKKFFPIQTPSKCSVCKDSGQVGYGKLASVCSCKVVGRWIKES